MTKLPFGRRLLLRFIPIAWVGIPTDLLGDFELAASIWGRERAITVWLKLHERLFRKDKSGGGYPLDWNWRREVVRERCDGLCDYCGVGSSAARLDTHHKHPLRWGGDHRLSNLVLLCADCHQWEHDRLESGGRGHYYPKRGPGEQEGHGFCIRCGDEIPANPWSPYCGDCFSSWVRYRNYEYEEHHCHTCGESARTSRARPFWQACYAERSSVLIIAGE